MRAGIIVLMIEDVLAVLSIMLAVAIKPPPLDRTSGKLILENDPIVRIIGLLCCEGMVLVLTVLVIIFPFQNPSDPYAAAGMLLGFFLLGSSLYLESKSRVEVDENGLAAWSVWSGSKAFSWADVREVRYSIAASQFIVASTTEQKIRINATLMRGVGAFCQIVEEMVSPEKLTPAKYWRGTMNR
jgi:hypothetical protein